MAEEAATDARFAATQGKPFGAAVDGLARRGNATCGCGTMGVSLRIGIDLGGTKIEAAAIDPEGRIRARRRIATPVGDYDGSIAARADLALDRRDEADKSEVGACASVGVGIPGTIVVETGLVK